MSLHLGSTSGKKIFMIPLLVFKAEILNLLVSCFGEWTFSLKGLAGVWGTDFRDIISLRKNSLFKHSLDYSILMYIFIIISAILYGH